MKLDWMSIFMLWTPLSVALLAIFFVTFGGAAISAYIFRRQVVAWFFNRLRETSSEHAFYLALTTTAAWSADCFGLMPDDAHVPLGLVKTGWAAAIVLFIKRDGRAQTPVGAAAKQLAVILSMAGTALALGACGTPGAGGAAWSSSQQAYVDLVTYQAGQQIVATVARQPSLSSRDVAAIKAGEGAASSSLIAISQASLAGGSIALQALSGVSAAAQEAATHLQDVLSSAHGSVSPDALQIAQAAGLSALASAPAVLLAIDRINGGFAPTAADLAGLVKTIQDEDASIQAIGAGP